MLLLQLTLQTQNSSSRQQQNAAVLRWHKDTEEQARLARQVMSDVEPCTMDQPSQYAQSNTCSINWLRSLIMQQYVLHHKRL